MTTLALRPLFLPLVLSTMALTACVSTPKTPDAAGQLIDPVTHQALMVTDTSDPTDFGPAADETGANPTQFSKDNLMALMTAEMAARDQDYDLVLQNYLKVARETRDEAVVTRAFSAAQYLKNEAAFTEMTLLWAEIAPDNVEVQQQAAFELIKMHKLPEALSHMEKVLELEGPASFDRVAMHAKSLPPEERAQLLQLYEQILARHPDNGELRYGYAVLLELNNQPDRALATTESLLNETPDNSAVITLHARLLKNTQGNAKAIAFLKAREKLLMSDMQLGNFYARALIDTNELQEAEKVYKQLAKGFPDATHLRLSYALVALENGKVSEAKKTLLKLVEEGQHANEAHFYLARIAELEKDTNTAILEYRQVERGGNYFNALARAAFLLTEAGKDSEAQALFAEARQSSPAQEPQIWELEINLLTELNRIDDALALADQALNAYPDSHSLLYVRAMLQERKDNLEGMERDLRAILEEDPQNAVALNALGYTLVDRTDRLDEARQLIEKAYAIDPQNPAIIDSVGWLLFRTNQIEQSISYLEQAYAKFPDPEVGAHLGEVYWVSGQKDKALKIFRENYTKDPAHRILDKTLKRLGIDLSQTPEKAGEK